MNLPEPAPENAFLAEHVRLLRDSLFRYTGRDLIAPGVPEERVAAWLFQAPFALVSHDVSPDPVFNYGNRTALELFEMSWAHLTALPSRKSAELPNRRERARLLEAVNRKGYITGYSGIRISRGGRRFRIEGATVWNLVDRAERYLGQAARFDRWEFLSPAAGTRIER